MFTVDTGMTCVWGARYLQATGKRHMLGSFNHGSMANALPQAIGAALAYPDRQVVALCGDGGLSMTLGDLETVVQYKLPIKIIVFNNRSLGMVKLEMEVDGLPDWQTNMLNPDFAQVAEAMGMTGFNVSDPEEVLTTLLNAFELDGPVLVNIMTDPNALAMPPKIEFGQMVGFAQSMYKLLINGRSQEVIDTINSNFKHIREVFLWDIVGVYLREGLPDLIRVTTVTIISLIGETAMAGAVGAGGLGTLAINYGKNMFNNDVIFVATLLILLTYWLFILL